MSVTEHSGESGPVGEHEGERRERHRERRVRRVRRYRSIDPRQPLGRRYNPRQIAIAIAVGVLAVLVSIYLIDQRAHREQLLERG